MIVTVSGVPLRAGHGCADGNDAADEVFGVDWPSGRAGPVWLEKPWGARSPESTSRTARFGL